MAKLTRAKLATSANAPTSSTFPPNLLQAFPAPGSEHARGNQQHHPLAPFGPPEGREDASAPVSPLLSICPFVRQPKADGHCALQPPPPPGPRSRTGRAATTTSPRRRPAQRQQRRRRRASPAPAGSGRADVTFRAPSGPPGGVTMEPAPAQPTGTGRARAHAPPPPPLARSLAAHTGVGASGPRPGPSRCSLSDSPGDGGGERVTPLGWRNRRRSRVSLGPVARKALTGPPSCPEPRRTEVRRREGEEPSPRLASLAPSLPTPSSALPSPRRTHGAVGAQRSSHPGRPLRCHLLSFLPAPARSGRCRPTEPQPRREAQGACAPPPPPVPAPRTGRSGARRPQPSPSRRRSPGPPGRSW